MAKILADLQRARNNKAAVDAKLRDAIKVGERAYQLLLQADRKQTELEQEIERLRRWREASDSSSSLLDSAATLCDLQVDRFEGLISHIKRLESDLERSCSDLVKTQDLKKGLSKQLLKTENRSIPEKVSPLISMRTSSLLTDGCAHFE